MLLFFSCAQPNTPLERESNQQIQQIPDSLIYKINQFYNKEKKVDYLLSLCEQWHAKHPNWASVLATQAETISQTAKLHQRYRAKALYWRAYLINHTNPQNLKLQNALTDIKICIALLRQSDEPLWLARALNESALIHYNLYEEKTGALYNQEAKAILEKHHDNEADVLRLWGDIYRTAGNIELYTSANTDSVLMHFDRSHQYYSRIPDTTRVARILVNRAIVYDKRGELELADSCYRLAIALYEKMDHSNQTAEAYLEFGTYFANKFKHTKYEQWFDSSNLWLRAALALQPDLLTEVYYQLGANFQNMALYHEGDPSGLFDSTTYYYGQVLELGVREKNTKYINEVSEEIAKVCPNISAKVCSNLLMSVKEAYQAIVDSTKFALQQSYSDMENFKDSEARRKQQQLWLGLGLSFLGILLGLTLFFHRSRVALLNKQLTTQLEALRAQMNPHFISNCLNAIDSLVLQDRKDEASEYIIDFSRLCRLVLNNSKREMISLEKELETLGYYLSLEKLRMGEKLSYSFEIDEDLNKSAIQIPPMLLQPFIENAIMHGIQKKQAPGHVFISIQSGGANQLECIIEDDGIGRKKAQALQDQSLVERPSWGIAISQERIEAIKKIKGSKITIIDLINDQGKGGGTRVNIRFPIITKNEQ